MSSNCLGMANKMKFEQPATLYGIFACIFVCLHSFLHYFMDSGQTEKIFS